MFFLPCHSVSFFLPNRIHTAEVTGSIPVPPTTYEAKSLSATNMQDDMRSVYHKKMFDRNRKKRILQVIAEATGPTGL